MKRFIGLLVFLGFCAPVQAKEPLCKAGYIPTGEEIHFITVVKNFDTTERNVTFLKPALKSEDQVESTIQRFYTNVDQEKILRVYDSNENGRIDGFNAVLDGVKTKITFATVKVCKPAGLPKSEVISQYH